MENTINKELLEDIINGKKHGQFELSDGLLVNSSCLSRSGDIKNGKPYRLTIDKESVGIGENGKVYYTVNHAWDIINFREEKSLEYLEKRACEKTREEIVDEVINFFDFNKVADVMQFLKWEWITCGGVPSVPSKDEIISYAVDLINNTIDGLYAHPEKDEYSISSCGFYCTVYRDIENNPSSFFIKLKFCIESYETW